MSWPSLRASLGKSESEAKFIHDFTRAMWGRKGPYTSTEWLMAGSRSFIKMNPKPDIKVNIDVPEKVKTNKNFHGSLKIENLTDTDLNDIAIDFPEINGVKISNEIDLIKELKAKESRIIKLNIKFRKSDIFP